MYEPEEETLSSSPREGVFSKLKDALHRAFNKPYAADEIFGDALDASILYNDLLQKVGGNRAIADRLIEFERGRAPQSTRRGWIQNTIQRWQDDN